jgi:protein O-mannosyl-transferase
VRLINRFNNKNSLFFALVLLVLCLIGIFFFYLPGLSGDFVLDDIANLPPLFDTIKNEGFWYGVFGNSSGPLGRPLTFFTLALQQSAWPDPYYLKVVNLGIHLMNVVLVFILVRLLQSYLLERFNLRNANFYALIVAVIWALLPIQVSTVLYVIQRLVLLSTLFTLLGIIAFIWARELLEKGQNTRALMYFGASSICAILAIASKESGLLIFAYLICVELIISKKKPILNIYWKWFIWLALVAPLILFCLYLYQIKFYQGYSVRPFNLAERLLSESRVLWIYVHQIILPEPSRLGLYQESFPISRGFLNPVSTLVSCVAWVVVFILIGVSLAKGKVQFFFPCLWFFAGHLMESTVISLELYFEHRNYLASVGIVLLGLYGFIYLRTKISSDVLKKVFIGVGILYILALIAILRMQTNLWGDPLLFNYVHATERVDSIRARSLLVDYYQSVGEPNKAYEALNNIERDFPNEPALFFLKLQFVCTYPKLVAVPDINNYATVLQNGDFSNGTLKGIEGLMDMKANQLCEEVDYRLIFKGLTLLKDNKKYSHKFYFLARFEAMLHLQRNDLQGAIEALDSIPHRGYDDAVGYARLLAAAGQYEKALSEVDSAKTKVGKGISKMRKEKELEELSDFIREDIKTKQSKQ